jgi:hypothetical protein
MAISTNGTVIARLAGALYNTQMSNATYEEVKALDPSSLANALYARDFSSATDATVATTLVTNLGLSAVEGLTNWVAAQLTAAGSAKGAKIVELLNGFAQMSADATYGAAATAFNTKVDAALAASQTTGNAGGTFAAVGGPAPVTNATFTLTTDVEDATGGAGNDTFNALSADTDSTLNAGDLIDGGAGVDTLKISVTVDGAQAAAFETANLENIQIRALDTGDNFDATLWDGVEKLISYRSTAEVEVDALQNNMTLAVERSAADLTVVFADDALESDAATLNLEVSDADDIAIDVSVGGDDVITTLSIAAVGDNIVDVSTGADGIDTINVTGSGTLELTNAGQDWDDVTDVDLSGNSGGVTLDLSTADALASLEGGSGDDVITVDAIDVDATISLGAGDDLLTAGSGDLDDAASVEGGSGTDIISSVALSTANRTIISGFETLALAGESRSIDVSRFSNNSFANLLIDGNLGGATTISKLAGTKIEIEVAATTTAVLTATLATATGSSDKGTITFNDDATAETFAGLTSAGLETLEIVSGGDGANEVSAITMTDNTLASIVITGDQDFTLEAPTTNTTAVASTTSAATSASALTMIDGSAATGDLTITGPTRATYSFTTNGTFYHSYTTTIKTGSGDDTVTSGATATTTVYTNDGDDTVTLNGTSASAYVGEGTDDVTVKGAGATVDLGSDEDADVIEIYAAAATTISVPTGFLAAGANGAFASTTKFLSVVHMTEDDEIDATDYTNDSVMTDLTTTADDYLSLVDAMNAVIDATSDGDASYFQWDADTYVYVDGETDFDSDTAGADDANYGTVIKITGTVDVDMALGVITIV